MKLLLQARDIEADGNRRADSALGQWERPVLRRSQDRVIPSDKYRLDFKCCPIAPGHRLQRVR